MHFVLRYLIEQKPGKSSATSKDKRESNLLSLVFYSFICSFIHSKALIEPWCEFSEMKRHVSSPQETYNLVREAEHEQLWLKTKKKEMLKEKCR